MLLPLGAVRKRVSRHDGLTRVTPYLLRPKELLAELDDLIRLYDSLLGQPRSFFPEERPAELVGDYRLARCLQTCLLEWYEWRSPTWPDTADERESLALLAGGITSPSELRLALYEYVNQNFGGYLEDGERESALDTFAARLGIRRATLASLQRLDTQGEAVLARTAVERPTAANLAVRYNQRAVETLLSNASQVEWILPATVTDGSGGGLGSVVKRVCFLARRMGIRYDVALAGRLAGRSLEKPDDDPGVATLQEHGRPVSILLYGPPQVMGAPVQYGERLARLARTILGYRSYLRSPGTGTASDPDEGLRGIAEIYLYGRTAQFRLDSRLLQLLGHDSEDQTDVAHGLAFDSLLEHDLHADFAALSAAGEVRGWLLEREPEPLLVDDTILVPDFALTRGHRRIYLEIAGYWRPGYRERKARKLAALRHKVDMIVAAPESAHAEFAELEDDFPFLWYAAHPSAQAILDLLERDFNDRLERLAALDIGRILLEVERRGRIPSRETMALLHVYSRSELALAVTRIQERAGILWLEGIGLCSSSWCRDVLAEIAHWVGEAPEQKMALTSLGRLISASEPLLEGLGDPEVELLATMSGCSILRTSIFDVEALAPGVDPVILEKPHPSPARMLPTQPHTSVRRKHSRAQHESLTFFPNEPEHDSR